MDHFQSYLSRNVTADTVAYCRRWGVDTSWAVCGVQVAMHHQEFARRWKPDYLALPTETNPRACYNWGWVEDAGAFFRMNYGAIPSIRTWVEGQFVYSDIRIKNDYPRIGSITGKQAWERYNEFLRRQGISHGAVENYRQIAETESAMPVSVVHREMIGLKRFRDMTDRMSIGAYGKRVPLARLLGDGIISYCDIPPVAFCLNRELASARGSVDCEMAGKVFEMMGKERLYEDWSLDIAPDGK